MTHQLGKRTLFVGASANDPATKTHTNFVLENHNGLMRFNPQNDDRLLAGNIKYAESLETEKSLAGDRSHSTLLSTPKVNGCSVVVIRNRTTGDLFTLHHTPDNLKSSTVYQPLFDQLQSQDQIDVLVCAGNVTSAFALGLAEKGVVVNSSRIIPSKFLFDLEDSIAAESMVSLGYDGVHSIFDGSREPKSLHIIYDPTDDRLLIYGDSHVESEKPACYVSEGIFSDPQKQISMKRVDNIHDNNYAVSESESWDKFQSALPLLSSDFVKRLTNSKASSCIHYFDEGIAKAFYQYLSDEDKETVETIADYRSQIAFINSRIPDPEPIAQFVQTLDSYALELDVARVGKAPNKLRKQISEVNKTSDEKESPETSISLPSKSVSNLRGEIFTARMAETFVEEITKQALKSVSSKGSTSSLGK